MFTRAFSISRNAPSWFLAFTGDGFLQAVKGAAIPSTATIQELFG